LYTLLVQLTLFEVPSVLAMIGVSYLASFTTSFMFLASSIELTDSVAIEFEL